MSGNEIVRMPILPFNMVNAHLIRSDAGCVTVYFLSPALKAYFRTVGLYPLTVFHVWRIPAALVFFLYGAHGALPPVFWILAGSGDFLSGVLALPLLRGPVARRTYLSKHLFDFSDFVVAVGTG